MSSLKRKRNLLDDKQKREIISYAKENQKLTQQQIADNLTIKWDLFILYLYIYFHENNIRVSHCCLAPNKQYYIYIMLRTIYIC